MRFPWDKFFNLPNFIPVRFRTKNNRTQSNSTHGEPGRGSLIPGISNHSACPSPTPVLTSPLIQDVLASREPANHEVSTAPSDPESFPRRASDMIQLVLPVVQGAAGSIPLAGAPIQATIGGLMTILQAIDRNRQNTADIHDLGLRLSALYSYLCNAPTAVDPREKSRRDSLTRILQQTSDTLANLSNRHRGYTSRVTQAITGCTNQINNYLLDYSVSSQMQLQNDVGEVLVRVKRLECFMGQGATQLTQTIALGVVTLVDATGYKHSLLVDHCTSFQQLNMMVAVLLERDCIEAQIQKRYMEKGQYDLCIDEGTHVTELTSHGWSKLEEGTTIVMRIIFEQRKRATPQYQCHICKTWNELISGSVDLRLTHCSIDCQGCNRRFQISLIELYRKAKEGAIDGMTSEPSKIDTNQTTETEMWLIRNFHVQQIVRQKLLTIFI
ncbi:hypothetical protein K503DRAFT_335541 [Rhizopogon vinicolor AM-OR11-026]|uniref:Ubiquitin-like domain-containing protein n=1 Tax=Rhizopogon vinicolor AM-OR11-026 TaxID=1314800 RepID=A0A1B7MTP5_9AGAM|nr:hypothetical protein K503DRAFT_335541 [Rhizopogon vinicolor AM-OR11-026]